MTIIFILKGRTAQLSVPIMSLELQKPRESRGAQEINVPIELEQFARVAREEAVRLIKYLLKKNMLPSLVPYGQCKYTHGRNKLKAALKDLGFPHRYLNEASIEYEDAKQLCLAKEATRVTDENLHFLMADKCELVSQIVHTMAQKRGLEARIAHASFVPNINRYPKLLFFKKPATLMYPHSWGDGEIKHTYVEVKFKNRWWAVDVLAEGFGDTKPAIWPFDKIGVRRMGEITKRSRGQSLIRTHVAESFSPVQKMFFAIDPDMFEEMTPNEALAFDIGQLFEMVYFTNEEIDLAEDLAREFM